MAMNMSWYKKNEDSIELQVYLQPGAKVTEIVGIHHGALKIRLNIPPIEGRANEALRKYLAQLFNVPLRQVILLRGKQSRKKVIKIIGSIIHPDIFII